MKTWVVVGLIVAAFALAGAGLGHRPGSAEATKAIRCELVLEGVEPGARRTDTKEPLLAVTKDPSGLMKGYVVTPYAYLNAKKVCTDGDPLEVTWQSWQGTLRVDDVGFLNQSVVEVPVYDSDPLGLRTWKAPPPTAPSASADPSSSNPTADPAVAVDPREVKLNQPEMDIRLGTDLTRVSFFHRPDGSTELVYQARKYSPPADDWTPYPNIEVTIQQRCSPDAPWTDLAKPTTTPTGEFDLTINPTTTCPSGNLELQGIPADSPDTWGLPTAMPISE